MKAILLTISLISITLLAVGQENKSKNTDVDVQIILQDDHELRIQKIENEILDIDRKIESMNASIVPRDENDRKIHRAKLSELNFQKQWREKELSIARTEALGDDVTGTRDEADALKARYTAMRDRRINLEREAAAIQAEKDDERPIPNEKLKMQKKKLHDELTLKKKALNREQNSTDPDARRIAELKGEIERLQRNIDDLEE